MEAGGLGGIRLDETARSFFAPDWPTGRIIDIGAPAC